MDKKTKILLSALGVAAIIIPIVLFIASRSLKTEEVVTTTPTKRELNLESIQKKQQRAPVQQPQAQPPPQASPTPLPEATPPSQ